MGGGPVWQAGNRRLARLARAGLAVAAGVGLLAGMSGCSQPDDLCSAIKSQFSGVAAPDSLDHVSPELARQLSEKYAAVAKAASADSKAAWSALAQFWKDFAAASGDTDKLANLKDQYDQVAANVQKVQSDTAACNLS